MHIILWSAKPSSLQEQLDAESQPTDRERSLGQLAEKMK